MMPLLRAEFLSTGWELWLSCWLFPGFRCFFLLKTEGADQFMGFTDKAQSDPCQPRQERSRETKI